MSATRRLTEEEAWALARVLARKVACLGLPDDAYDPPETEPRAVREALQIVVDTELIVSGDVPLEAFTEAEA